MSQPYSCWDGWELTGKVARHAAARQVLVEGGKFVGSKTGGALPPAHGSTRP